MTPLRGGTRVAKSSVIAQYAGLVRMHTFYFIVNLGVSESCLFTLNFPLGNFIFLIQWKLKDTKCLPEILLYCFDFQIFKVCLMCLKMKRELFSADLQEK